MATNPFGKPLVLNIYLVADDGTALVPDDTEDPDVYLFANPPTRTQARDGTGAMSGFHVTSWVGTGDFRTVSFPAVSDPSPDSPVSEHTYYLAANFHLDAAGERQTIVKSVTLRRVAGQSETLTLEQADLEAIDKSVAHIFGSGSASIASLNSTVLRLIRGRFAARGVRWDQVTDPGDLKDAAVFLALHLAFASQMRTTGDTADRKQQLYYGHYKELIDTAVLSFDENSGDSLEGEEVDADNTTWSFDR